MGYTHDWNRTAKAMSEEDFAQMVRDVQMLIATAESGWYDSDPVEIRGGDGKEPYAGITDDDDGGKYIMLNGAGALAHETFVLSQKRIAYEWQDDSEKGRQFCKTARKPYDALVVACLIYLDAMWPQFYNNISSDGERREWEEGLRLAQFGLPEHRHRFGVPDGVEDEPS